MKVSKTQGNISSWGINSYNLYIMILIVINWHRILILNKIDIQTTPEGWGEPLTWKRLDKPEGTIL